MRWSASDDGGFSRVEAWFPPSTRDPAVSVEAQRGDPNSTLHAYREAIALRTAHPALAHGRVEVLPTRGGLLALWRRAPDSGGVDVLLLANLAAGELDVNLAELSVSGALVALAPGSGPAGVVAGRLTLPSNSLTLLTPTQ
jgi:alpha-glucosidase